MTEVSQIRQGIIPLLGIFDLYAQIVFMPTVLFGEICRVLEESCLTAYADSRVYIKW